jgi:short-subunit dehydrogenase
MKQQRFGYILNVSSISAVMPYPTISVYGPTKAFLHHFTHAIRIELQPYGVHVTCLVPGATDTPFNDPMQFNMSRGKKFGIVRSPESVARAGIGAMFRNRALCIPGWINKVIFIILPVIPHILIRLIYRRKLKSASGND